MYHYSSGLLERRLKKRLMLAGLLGLIPFISIVLLGFGGWEKITTVDYQLSQYLYQLHSPQLNAVMTAVTHIGDLLVQTAVTLVVVIILFILKKWRTAIWYGLTVLFGAGLLNAGVKQLYARARPSQIEPLVDIGGYSFPSGHSMGSMIVYGGLLFLILRRLRSPGMKFLLSVLVSLTIFGIGISRIYLGVHFPTDVIGGFSLGFAWLFLSMSLVGLKVTNKEVKLRNRYSIKRL